MVPLNQDLDSQYLVSAIGPEQNYLPVAASARGAKRHYSNPRLCCSWRPHWPSIHIPSHSDLSLALKFPRCLPLHSESGLDKRVKDLLHLSVRRLSFHGSCRNHRRGYQSRYRPSHSRGPMLGAAGISVAEPFSAYRPGVG